MMHLNSFPRRLVYTNQRDESTAPNIVTNLPSRILPEQICAEQGEFECSTAAEKEAFNFNQRTWVTSTELTEALPRGQKTSVE